VTSKKNKDNLTESSNRKQKYTLSILVTNESGVLTRIAALFGRRNYNIESLAVGQSEKKGLSRMTVVSLADQDEIEQIKKQLEKLIDIVSVENLNQLSFVDREMLLIRIKANSQNRTEISQIIDLFRARIVDVALESLIIEVTGDQGKLNAILDLLQNFGVESICRTGQIALPRGPKNDQRN